MASPVAAGCAAMIKSKFPSFTHEQVAEQLRNTCDNIYQLPGNINYIDKLGKGRVNLFKAVTDSVSPGVVAEVLSITDGNNNVFVGDDTLRIVVRFKNLLHATANMTTQLTQTSNLFDTIIQDAFTAGMLNTFDTISNYVQTYKVVIKPTAPINYTMPLKVVMTDGAWSDFLAFTVVVNVDYVNIEVNDISTTQTSKGRIGYNTQGPGEGLGFKFQGGPSNLFEMGLMIADGVHRPANAVRNEVAGGSDVDFGYDVRVHEGNFINSDYFASGVCNNAGPTSPNDSLRLPIEVSHYTYAWSTNPDRGYVIVEYVIKNTGTDPLTNIYAGLYADWDVNDVADTSTVFYQSNRDSVDFLRRMGITYNTWNDGYYCGIKLLSYSAPFHHYAIDNVSGGGGGIDIYDDLDHFSDPDKYAVLSTNRDVAGHTAINGNDVCDVTSTGPRTIAPGDSMVAAFALICGLDLNSILSSADAAQQKYDTHIDVEEFAAAKGQMMLGIYPNPLSKTATVTYTLEKNSQVELSLYNIMGEKIKSFSAGKQGLGEHQCTIDATGIPGGNYFLQLNAGGTIEVRKIVVTR